MRRLGFVAGIIKVVLSLASLAVGAEIVGPSKVEPYRMARFSAKGGEKSSFSWAVSPRGKTDSITCKDTDFAFVGPPGAYEVELLEIGPTGDPAKPFSLERTYHTVTIGIVPPTPPEPPGPNPPAPEVLTGLAKTTFDLCVKHVPLSARQAKAVAIADAWSATARQLQNGATWTDTAYIAALREAVGEAMGTDAKTWEPFRLALGAELDSLEKSGQHNTPAQWYENSIKIAQGIKGAANGS